MERRELLKKATGIGLASGFLASPFSGAFAAIKDNQNNTPATLPDGTTPDDWHRELTNRIKPLLLKEEAQIVSTRMGLLLLVGYVAV